MSNDQFDLLTEISQSAIRMLANREHSRFELKQKLLQRGYAADLVEQVLEKLIRQDLLSEQRFVENFVRNRVNKGYGPLRITAELQARGIDKTTIKRSINQTVLAEQQIKISQVRSKKFGSKLPTNAAEYAKQLRYLQYKGFSAEQIRLELRLSIDTAAVADED